MAQAPTRTSLAIPSLTPGWNIDAWSYLPRDRRVPLSVIVMANGLGCNKLLGLAAYAEQFCAAGYACLVFDYRRWGTSDGARRNAVYVSEQLEDYRTVVKYARLQPEYDPQRVIVWGFSFSGGHILTLSSEPALNVAAGISVNPYCGRPLPPFQFTRRYLALFALAALDLLAELLRLPPVHIPTAGPPGAVAALVAPGTIAGFDSVTQRASDFPNQIGAAIFFRAPRYNPSAALHRVRRPLLLFGATADAICPAAAVRRANDTLPTAEYVALDGGHFDAFAGNLDWERALRAQLEFLRRHFPV
ncbi:alpha/beta-hydrolase [Mycena rebaudengoi]|nr:alpha/beta-hydrolase [Mycena rebaudengoi]